MSSFRRPRFLPVQLDEDRLDENGNRDPADLRQVSHVGYANLLEDAFVAHLAARGIAVEGMDEARSAT
jgi:phosphate transport system permease protein